MTWQRVDPRTGATTELQGEPPPERPCARCTRVRRGWAAVIVLAVVALVAEGMGDVVTLSKATCEPWVEPATAVEAPAP